MGTEGNVFAQKGQRSGLCFECLRTVCSTRWSLRKKRRRHRRHSKGRMPEWLSLCRRMLANCVKRMKQTSHSYERLSRAGVSSPDLLAVVVVLLLFISRTAAALVSALGVDTSPSKSILCDSTGWLCYLKTTVLAFAELDTRETPSARAGLFRSKKRVRPNRCHT